MKEKKRIKKTPGLGISLIPVILTVILLLLSVTVFNVDVQVPLILGILITSIVAIVFLGYTWEELEKGAITSVMSVMQAIFLLIVIGSTIGTWITGGVVPSLVYYGLQLVSPGAFLVVSMVLCSVVSIAAGGSWATVGTIGIALIGVARGLGIPVGMAGGAILSGAYFGDKMSPLSDTTNLAAAIAGAKLTDHIKHMLYSTIPSYIICIIIYGIFGKKFANIPMDYTLINGICSALESSYVLSPGLLLVPVIVIIIVAMKVPAIPGLFSGTLLGGICGIFIQKLSVSEVLNAVMYGAICNTGNDVVDELLTNGGFMNMMWVISLIICALAFGGVLEASGMMEAIAKALLKVAHSTGSLILVTAITSFFCNVLLGDHCLAISVPGQMFKEEYDKRGLAPRNLSRTLEDAGTVTSPLIPWNTCGATMSGFLGIATMTYVPYAYFCMLCPLITVIFGFTGYGIMKIEDDPSSDKYKGKKEV